MEKGTYVEELVEGREVEDIFAIKERSPPKEYSKGWFFRLVVGDRTGSVSLIYWGGPEKEKIQAIYEDYKIGDVVRVSGLVSSYKGKLQVTINEEDFHGLKKIEEGEYDSSDFIAHSKHDVDQMFSELLDHTCKIEDENMSKLVYSFLEDEDFVRSFKKSPYSKRYNNNYIGGLLEHTLDNVKTADSVSRQYPELNRDLMITGATLLDFGKVNEYEVTAAIELTTDSRLIGHTVLCERIIRDRIEELPGFPKELAVKISHIVLSHHGDYEWGSARSPRMEEAVALHHIDLLNARLNGFIQAKEDLDEEDQEMVYVSKEGVQRPVFTR